MIALIPVRSGRLPGGALEAIAEAGGVAILAGTDCGDALDQVIGVAHSVTLVELGSFQPGRWSRTLAPLLASHAIVVLPHSPDGRDLAPRLAAQTDRSLLAGAMSIRDEEISVIRMGGRIVETHTVDRPMIATLQPGVRSVERRNDLPLDVGEFDPADVTSTTPGESGSSEQTVPPLHDAELIEERPPDPSTMSLAEAQRIVGGGAGLGSAEAFDDLAILADALGASMGGTRVVMDWGWIPFERQIGTTGIVVDPDFYLALGISGAVQHTAGLGAPRYIISVNTEPHCAMMNMADLAIVCDAPAFLEALLARLSPAPAEA